MTDLAAVAYVSWGIWVAQCPRPDCLGSEHYGHAPITGHVGGLTSQGFRCNRCGLVCRSVWPDNLSDIEWVLSQRPLPETRNWLPGETLDELLGENIGHGIAPDELAAGPLRINDGRVEGLALTNRQPLMIGGD